MATIKIYTDGSCLLNPGGPGGWAFVVADHTDITITDSTSFFCGGNKETTNNAMELTAILEALRWAEDNNRSSFIIHSDSKYSMNVCNNWMHIWARNSWKNREGQKIANDGIVKSIYNLSTKVAFKVEWVAGHSGNVFNEFADSLASKMAFRIQGKEYAKYSDTGPGDRVMVGSSPFRIIAKFISTNIVVLQPIFDKRLKTMILEADEFDNREYIKI